jgi:hypothetical protein
MKLHSLESGKRMQTFSKSSLFPVNAPEIFNFPLLFSPFSGKISLGGFFRNSSKYFASGDRFCHHQVDHLFFISAPF